MSKWVVVEVNFEGSKRLLEGEYSTREDAFGVQEAMEWLHSENAYLVYTLDQWVYECENER